MDVLVITNVLTVTFAFVVATAVVGGNFYQHFDIVWGDGRAKILNNGHLVTLSLDKISGSGLRSKNEYLFGKLDMQIKLVPRHSAGTVTTYYLSSQGPDHDEIDFEFLGNVTGQPYTVHTNVYTKGKGAREQQFRLWFDPTADFHTYSILWNPQRIIFLVDNTPIRVFKNSETIGVPFPKTQPMRVYSTIWDAEWATQGGRVKTDWSKAPFTASFRNYKAKACVWSNGRSSCRGSHNNSAAGAWMNQQVNATNLKRLRRVQRKYMIYNYCTDTHRFPKGLPKECTTTA